NSELTLKVLSGCGVNDRWWAFVSSSSTVEYDVVITDTVTGAQRAYHHVAGQAAALLADTAAFPCS
ncbi:MAG TPA: hypothetical protein VN923_20550, partial [Thermoanaerobaculia bacterium]|nr:hypothetical protein [Thermoanaerobaculia bacterium]